uniref:ABC transporter B family member 10 n=1 Tax=Lygus hesperus TaxID=30085 RepID=A0A0A9X6L1_LYGHE
MPNIFFVVLVFTFQIIMESDSDSTNHGEPRIDGYSPVKIGISPTILKVFIKGNMLPEDIEKILELYAKEDKSPNEAEKSRNPMIDYLGKIYSFRNYDLLRPYRSIFRGLKTFGKHDHTTQSSWLKFLRRGKYLTDDYWELNQPEVTKMPYHRQREQARIEKLNKGSEKCLYWST